MNPSQENAIPRRDLLKSLAAAGAIGVGGCAATGSGGREATLAQSDASESSSQSHHHRKPSRQQRPYNGPYTGKNLDKIAFPMGGIGAGMICLEGTGGLSHVSLRHHPEVFNQPQVFAAVCIKGERNTARLL